MTVFDSYGTNNSSKDSSLIFKLVKLNCSNEIDNVKIVLLRVTVFQHFEFLLYFGATKARQLFPLFNFHGIDMEKASH